MGARYETRVSHVQLWIRGLEAQAPCGLVADDPPWTDTELVGQPALFDETSGASNELFHAGKGVHAEPV